ncbi:MULTISPECIES: glycosyl hydrolase family 28 protein [unclassified Streptomyces]|uniref:glycosyl hydrolase family 28 protein n=1 Tax=unclassified Streptomyces TaxID=2593676 RepID=UPI002740667C|nr:MULTISPECIES: glycosyl hydrolase family 28 protein [unclassified Streptomyces]
MLNVPSGKTLYLAGGAVLTAQVYFKDVERAAVTGRGVIASPYNGILCEGSKNIRVEDVIVLNPRGGYVTTLGESENVHIRKLRGFSSRGNGDGIDIFSSSSVVLDGCFLRTSDDCVAIYL